MMPLYSRQNGLAEQNITGKYDAIILAEAGLDRMGWQNRISQVNMMPLY